MEDLEAYWGVGRLSGDGVEGNRYRKVECVRICQDIKRVSGRSLPVVWKWL